jgi:uncharacterized protein YycO
MGVLTAVFSRRWGITSFLIRLFSWGGQWSHVGIYDRNTGTVIEASYKGVREISLGEFIRNASKVDLVDYECPDVPKALEFARSQIGEPYDYLGILGFVVREPLYNKKSNKWFCNRLFEESLKAGGRDRFREDSGRITVYQSYKVK